MIHPMGSLQSKTQVLAITGGKGGVGKSNIALNLGAIMSQLGKKVCLLDADFGLPNIHLLLGLQPKLSLENVFNGEYGLQDVLLAGPFGLRVVPGASGSHALVNMDAKAYVAFIDSFNHLSEHFDMLIIDTASGISEAVARVAIASHEIIVVICDEPSSLVDAYSLIKILNLQHGIERFRVLVNMANNFHHAKQVYSKLNHIANKHLDILLNFVGWIPDDPFIRKAIQQQSAVVECYPSCKSALSFYQIAETLAQMPMPIADHGHTQFFMNQDCKLHHKVN